MRRARIKAVATVPVRRKLIQDTTPAAPSVQSDAKESDKSPDKNDQPTNEPSTSVKQATPIETVTTPQSPQELAVLAAKETGSKLESIAQSPRIAYTPVVKEKHQELENTPKSRQKAAVSPVRQKNQEIENIPKSPQRTATSPTKERKCLELSVHDNNKEVDGKLSSRLSQKNGTSAPIEASPIKTHQSRSHFTRPTPRLDGSGRVRRNSIQGSGASASESEDDSRRSSSVVPNRARNDSICSTFSLKDTGNIGNISKLNLGQKRRTVVSESARKLAESRREFFLKHENKTPDKSKLTMYDLIYYNPVTNPMAPKPVQNRQAVRKNSICSIVADKKEEEIVDEPEEMLVPQVKVGPNGQLIIDEQSLVIDQYKAQENIDRSDILIDDETSGFYKRRSKSKDWTKWETLKFYKALNTYGTDFLLMQSIFPQRTRQELKLKYKKEEKMNHNLVEKALVYQEFDTEALEKDLAKVDESERLETESNKKVKKKDHRDKKRKRARCQKMAEEVNCEDEQNSDTNKNSDDGQSSDENKIEKPAPKKRRATRKRKMKVSNTNSSNESANNDSDINPESYEVQTTRSGRTTRKVKKLQKPKRAAGTKSKDKSKEAAKIDDEQNNNEEGMESSEEQNKSENPDGNEALEAATTNISNLANEFKDVSGPLEPGSWIVLSKDSVDEPGKKIIQHYIVSPDYDASNPTKKDNFIPINLPPDVVNTVTDCIENIKPEIVS